MTPQALERYQSEEDCAEHSSSESCRPYAVEQSRTSHRAQPLLGEIPVKCVWPPSKLNAATSTSKTPKLYLSHVLWNTLGGLQRTIDTVQSGTCGGRHRSWRCTDGLTKHLSDEEIAAVLTASLLLNTLVDN